MNDVVMAKKLYAICVTTRAGETEDRQKIRDNHIKKKMQYAITDIHLYRFHTNIELLIPDNGEDRREFFNSVFFEIVDGDGKEYNVFRDLELIGLYLDENGMEKHCIDYLKHGEALPFDM